MLIGVHPVCFKPPVSPADAPDQGNRSVNEKDAAQNCPNFQGGPIALTCCQSKTDQRKAQETASYITHENLGWRPIPHEEPERRSRKSNHRNRQSDLPIVKPVQPGTGASTEDSLACGDAVNAVHKIKKIRGPRQKYDAD